MKISTKGILPLYVVALCAMAWLMPQTGRAQNGTAWEISPLLIGETIPNASLRRMDGSTVEVSELIHKQNTVLIFYRGGWCPYCNSQLGGLAEIDAELTELGYQILAISPDQPDKLAESMEKLGMSYQLFSDSKLEFADAMGLSFQVDEKTIKRYKTFGIDLIAASGEDHQRLPVPAVYLVNKKGEVVFNYVNPDYKVRLSPTVLLAAAKSQK